VAYTLKKKLISVPGFWSRQFQGTIWGYWSRTSSAREFV